MLSLSFLCRSSYGVIINTNVPAMLEDLTLQMSMFTPIDFSKMRQTTLGIKMLDDRLYASRLRNVSWHFFILAGLPTTYILSLIL